MMIIIRRFNLVADQAVVPSILWVTRSSWWSLLISFTTGLTFTSTLDSLSSNLQSIYSKQSCFLSSRGFQIFRCDFSLTVGVPVWRSWSQGSQPCRVLWSSSNQAYLSFLKLLTPFQGILVVESCQIAIWCLDLKYIGLFLDKADPLISRQD